MRFVELAWAAALAGFVFAVHLLSPNVTQGDSRWSVFTAWSLIHEGDADLNEFVPQMERAQFYAIECVQPGKAPWVSIRTTAECAGGRFYNYYPLGVPLMIAPALAAMDATVQAAKPWTGRWAETASTEPRRRFLRGELLECTGLVELILASAVIALASACLYLYFRASQSRAISVLLVLVFAFATSAWSTGSRALWMHGFSMLLIAAGMLFLKALPDRWWTTAGAGAVLTLAFFVRPTNVGALACFALWLLIERRERLVWFAAGALPVALLFGAFHGQIYGSWLPSYSRVQRPGMPGLSFGPHVPFAIAGNLIGPARGLLVYSPFCLFSLWGLWRGIRGRKDGYWPHALAGVALIQFVIVSLYEDWYGGDSYGPRYFSDVAPVFVAALVWALPAIRTMALRGAFAASLLISVWMHYQGAFCWPCVDWSARVRVARGNSALLWDWTDPPFLAGFKRTVSPPPQTAPR